jgi:hypothetical protein
MAASSSSPSQVICASFNQENRYARNRTGGSYSLRLITAAAVGSDSACWDCFSLFSIGTKDGFEIFDASNGRLCYKKSEVSFRGSEFPSVSCFPGFRQLSGTSSVHKLGMTRPVRPD